MKFHPELSSDLRLKIHPLWLTMCDFEKREIDRFRVEIDPVSKLAAESHNLGLIQKATMMAQSDLATKGFIISETMLNSNFIDGESASKEREITSVSLPYTKDLGKNYAD